MAVRMTPKKMEVLDFIKSYIKEHGYSPSFQNICDGVNVASRSSVFCHLQSLQELGYITYEPGEPRTISVIGMHAMFEEDMDDGK